MTLHELAIALTGMPRSARLMIRLPDGRLADIDHVTAAYVGEGNQAHAGPSGGGTYGLILVPTEP
jgi:hypothetical protein